MDIQYIVPDGKAPTDAEVRAFGKKMYEEFVSHFIGTPMPVMASEEDYIRDGWEKFRQHLEINTAIPVDTVAYTADPKPYGDVMPVAEWRESCKYGDLIDYDGFGHPMKDGRVAAGFMLKPSTRHLIPKDATHIEWYNK